jgi:hypothetical protein
VLPSKHPGDGSDQAVGVCCFQRITVMAAISLLVCVAFNASQ